MYRMVSYDIASEKHDKRRERKRIWLNEWSDLIVNAADRAWLVDADYFLDEDEIYKAIANFNGSNDSWVWLVAMEALLFKAYAPLPDGRRWDSKGMKLARPTISPMCFVSVVRL